MAVEYFLQTESGPLFVANGLDAVLRWDGQADQFEEVGLDAPANAITVSGSGAGPIVGTYYGCQRFLDRDGNWSNLSPISAAYEATGTTGTITSATNASPIVVTSAGHGLPTGATVKIEGVVGNTSANNTWIITVIDGDTFSLDDSHGTAEYVASGTWTSGILNIEYTDVGVPIELKAVRRQILRNTDGQAATFYVDVDTTDLSSTAFSSARDDNDLSTQEAVPLLDSNGNLFANRHDKPTSFFSAMVSHLGRVLACCTVEYSTGHCKAAIGSATIYGVGTDWKRTFAGRELHIDGASLVYTIDSVDEDDQTITLTEPYESPTNLFLFYSIKPPPAYRRVVAWSESGLPQSWPPGNQLTIPDTGDEITGILAFGTFVYVLEKRHMHKLTFFSDPSKDIGIFLAVDRGCINNRCWQVVDANVYLLDENGAYRFGGTKEVEKLSEPIQSIFRDDETASEFKIDFRQRDFFHSTIDRQRQTVKWFLSLDGAIFPRQCLSFQYALDRWWIDELPYPIGGACVGDMADLPMVFYGGEHRKVLAASVGTLDVADADISTVRGTATSSTGFTLTDSLASFVGVVNAPLSIVHGRGKGQTRRIVEIVSATQLRVSAPWAILPDTTSIYQIGGIHWKFRSQWFRFAPNEMVAQRRFEFIFQTTLAAAYADMRFRLDLAKDGETDGKGNEIQAQTIGFGDRCGVKSTKGETDLTVDMTRSNGLVDVQLPGGKDFFVQGRRYTQFDLEGWTNEDRARLYQMLYEGAIPGAGLGGQEQ